MLDPRGFRDADAFAAVAKSLSRRRAGADLEALLEQLRGHADRRRVAIAEADARKAELNAKSRQVGELKRRGEDPAALLEELGGISRAADEASAAARAACSRCIAAHRGARRTAQEQWHTCRT